MSSKKPMRETPPKGMMAEKPKNFRSALKNIIKYMQECIKKEERENALLQIAFINKLLNHIKF